MFDYFDNVIKSTSPLIMGIVNVTPDSFSDGGKYLNIDAAVNHAINLIENGADIIDIGGESTRPGAESVTIEEEIQRVIPVIEKLLSLSPKAVISIDTTKSEVAEKALESGALIVNDISGGTFDKNIFSVTKKYDAILVLMHIKGKPKTMQDAPYYDNVVLEVKDFLLKQIKIANDYGIQKIIIDPGIGFGKKVFENYELLKNLKEFYNLKYPVLIGVSRKSLIGKALNLDIHDRENATTIMEMFAIQNGAKIIRTHNVKNTREIIQLLSFINNPKQLLYV